MKEKWSHARSAATEGDLSTVDDQIFICHYNTLKTIQRDTAAKPEDLPSGEQVGYWYWGSTGAGKTFAAINEFPGAYRKIANNKWWCGYNGEDNVIIDDLDKAHAFMGYHLKIWGDRYAFNSEIKGRSAFIRPKSIVVTSNYHPRDIWEDQPTLGPILRRFKVVHFQSLMDNIPRDERDEERLPYAENFAPEVPPRPVLRRSSTIVLPESPLFNVSWTL